jgi:hypothetical protein
LFCVEYTFTFFGGFRPSCTGGTTAELNGAGLELPMSAEGRSHSMTPL